MNNKIQSLILFLFLGLSMALFFLPSLPNLRSASFLDKLYGKTGQTSAQPAGIEDPDDVITNLKFDSMLGFIKEVSTLGTTGSDLKEAPRSATESAGTDPDDGTAPPPPFDGPDTTNIPCDSRTGDAGVQDGWSNGNQTRIRTCSVPRIGQVNSQISKQVVDLMNAAEADGINLSGGSFRSCAGQVAIYNGHCPSLRLANFCPQPNATKCPGAAKPGFSNHQMGFAIDFNCDGALIPRYHPAAGNNRCFQWLVANARRFGLYEWGNDEKASVSPNRDSAGYEGWHWSINGK